MTVTPDENCQLSNEEIQKITYYNRATDFCGQISFHDINGNFTNAWLYENGVITKGLRALNNNQRKQRSWVYTSTKFCWHTGYIKEGVFYETNVDCHTTWDVSYLMDIDNSEHGGGSGGNTSGGGSSGAGGFLPSINYNQNFINSDANCVKKILDQGVIINKLLNGYQPGDSKLDLKFTIGELPDGVNGRTQFTGIINGVRQYLITIDQDRLDDSAIEIARTMLHECFHAYIFGQIHDLANFTGLTSDFANDWKLYRNLLNSHHEYIIDKYLIFMMDGLEDFMNTLYMQVKPQIFII